MKLSGNKVDLAAIQSEMVTKFSGSVYKANCQLDHISEDGTTKWVVQYTRVSDGKRVRKYDGLIRRDPNGVTYAL